MTVGFKDEFQLRNFGFGYDKPYQFYQPAWRWHNGVFIAWRVFWVVWHIVWIVISGEDQVDLDAGEKWFIFLTNWGYFILTVQSILHLIVVLWSTCKTQAEDIHDISTTNWLEKLLWIFTSVSFDGTVIITIMFWGFIFTKLTKALSVMTHGVTMLYAVSDIFISASPTRLFHFIYTTLFGLTYGLFTLFYHFADGQNNNGKPYVYEILDWSNPGLSVGLVAGLMFVVTPIVHLFVFGLYTFRVFLSERCACGRQSDKRDDNIA